MDIENLHREFFYDVNIALVALAIPLLIQIIIHISEKYKSDVIKNIFFQEAEFRLFLSATLISVIMSILASLNISNNLNWGDCTDYINNSGNILLFITTVFSLISYGFLGNKIITYLSVSKLISHLSNKSLKNIHNLKYFNALVDIILAQLSSLKFAEKDGILFYLERYYSENNEKINKGGNLPEELYLFPYDYIDKIITLKLIPERALLYRVVTNSYFLNNSKSISKETFEYMWRVFLLSSKIGNESNFKDQYVYACNYIKRNLKQIEPKYNYKDFSYSNQEEIDFRNDEIKNFKLFQLNVFAYILHIGKPKLLIELIQYTSSIPPDYPLLPTNLDELLYYYCLYDVEEKKNYFKNINNFSFPDSNFLERYVSERILIKRVLSIYLFFRIDNYGQEIFKEFVNIPKNVNVLKIYIENIDDIKNNIKLEENNIHLLSFNNYNLTLERVNDILETTKKQLLDYDSEIRQRAPIEKRIVDSMFKKSSEILLKLFSELKERHILNNHNTYKNKQNTHIIGEHHYFDRNNFTNNVEYHFLDMDNFLANSIVNRIYLNLANLFNSIVTHKCKIQIINIEYIISKLGLTSDYVVILYFSSHNIYFSSPDFEFIKNLFERLNIDYYIFEPTGSVGNSLFILKKIDLPNLYLMDLSDDEKLSKNIGNADKIGGFCAYPFFVEAKDYSDTLKRIFTNQVIDKRIDETVCFGIALQMYIYLPINPSVLKIEFYNEYYDEGHETKPEDFHFQFPEIEKQ